MKIKKEFYLISRTGTHNSVPYTEEVYDKDVKIENTPHLIELYFRTNIMKPDEPFTIYVDDDNRTFEFECNLTKDREKVIRSVINDLWIEGGTGEYNNSWHTNFIITNKKYAKIDVVEKPINFDTFMNSLIEEIENKDIMFIDKNDVYDFINEYSKTSNLYVDDDWWDRAQEKLIGELSNDKKSIALKLFYKVINKLDKFPKSFYTFYNKYYLPEATKYPALYKNFDNFNDTRFASYYSTYPAYSVPFTDATITNTPDIDGDIKNIIMEKFLNIKTIQHFK